MSDKNHIRCCIRKVPPFFFVMSLSWALTTAWPLLMAASAMTVSDDRTQQGNMAVDFTLSTLNAGSSQFEEVTAGTDALAKLHIHDAQTGQPLSGLHPKVWMGLRRSEMVAGETACADKVKNYLSGNLSARADVDLNNSVLFVLNHDKSISVINPQIALSRTKLESMIQLPGVGADWVLSQDKNHLYVTMPDHAAVAVINTGTRKVTKHIATGAEGQPRRIALQPDGHHVWVGLDGAAIVMVIDATTNQLVARVPVGRGLHAMAFTPDSRYALITNSDSDSISIVDTTNRTLTREISVGKTPVAVVMSPQGERAYVASLNDDHLTVIDMGKQNIHSVIPVKPGTTMLRIEPKGRFLFALNQLTSTVSVIDTTADTFIATSHVVKEPDQVSFTDQFAYIRGLGSDKVSLIELGELRKGRLVPVEIQIGQSSPAVVPDQIGVGEMMVPAPEGHGMMIASAPDKTIYYYMEGMMVPMGTFQTYKRMPRALMVLDRSLTETAPGEYSTTIHLPKEAGLFDVPVFIGHPRVVTCLQTYVAPAAATPSEKAKGPLAIEPLFNDPPIIVGHGTSLKFRVTDLRTQRPVGGLSDLQVLIFQPPGIWQRQAWGHELDNGIYEVNQEFPHRGQYRVIVRIPSRNMPYDVGSQSTVRVVDGDLSERANRSVP